MAQNTSFVFWSHLQAAIDDLWTRMSTALSSKVSSSTHTTDLAGKANTNHTHAITDVTGLQTALADEVAARQALAAQKQDTLQYDNTPTENSNKMVKSGGIFSAIAAALVAAKAYADSLLVSAKAYADEILSAAKSYAEGLVSALISSLDNGTIVPKLAGNIEGWESRSRIPKSDTWSDIVRTTAGDLSIDSSSAVKIMSIIPKTQQFFARYLKATGFNLLRYATHITGTNLYYILVPALPFGSYESAEQPNGILITNSNHENVQRTVYFKPLANGVPTAENPGSACSYTDSHNHRFYTCSQMGYMVFNIDVLANYCLHIGWSGRYDEYIAYDSAADAGSSVTLASIIHSVHDYDLLLKVGEYYDSIEREGSSVKWTRQCDRVRPSWTTVENEVEEGAQQTYTHTATIATMKKDAPAECGALGLTVNGTTVSYTDNNATATTDYVYFVLAMAVTGTASLDDYAVEDWGLEMLLEVVGEGYVTTQYATGYPDAIANLLPRVDTIDGKISGIQSDVAELKEANETFYPYIEDDVSYGVEFDVSVSSPACTRIGSTTLHRTLPVHSKMRGCLLSDNGEVVEYLPDDDWTSAVRDGSRGQVMVEIPKHYRKFETIGNKRRVRISEVPLTGYHKVPKMYVSAYQATVQRSTNKLASVVNADADYRGGGNNSAYDGTYRSFLGRPAVNISRTNFRNYARNRKSGSTEWNCMTYDMQKALYWLFVVEYATLNSQATYNGELTNEGYHQGGLGAGVTNWSGSNWNDFNGYYPFVPCGHTDSLGNKSGVVSYTASNGDGITVTSDVPRYRGVENPFGHIWQWTDGINVRINPTVENGGNGLSEVFVCSDPAKFNDSNYNGYSLVGYEARDSGYMKKAIFGEGGEIIPEEVGGGSSTYFCDYHYTSIPTSTALRGVRFGGDAHDGAYAGFVSALSYYSPSITHSAFGSRLCFIPAA